MKREEARAWVLKALDDASQQLDNAEFAKLLTELISIFGVSLREAKRENDVNGASDGYIDKTEEITLLKKQLDEMRNIIARTSKVMLDAMANDRIPVDVMASYVGAIGSGSIVES